MEPFKIGCVTCQASLSVRNASLLGQIVACPRCGSMVEVALPSTASDSLVSAVGEPVADSEFLPDTDQPYANETDAHETVVRSPFLVWPLAGLFLLGATVVGWLLARPSAFEEEVATSESVVAEELPRVEDLPDIEEAVEVAAEVVSEIALEIAPERVASAAETRLVVEAEVAEAPLVERAPVERAPVARRFDPLDFDPERVTLGEIEGVAEGRAVETVVSPVVEALGEVAESLEGVPSTVPVARRGPVGEDALGERDAAKQLGFVFPSLEFEEMRLVDCLRLFSQMSGVAVSVAPEQLLMAGVVPETKVSLSEKEVSAGEMLGRLLKPVRLEYEARGSQVVVLRRGAGTSRTIDYPVDDLLSGSTDIEQLGAWIEALVAPDSWQSGAGTLEAKGESLHIEQTEQVHYQVLIFLERLRLARDLSPRSRFPVKRLVGGARAVRVRELVAGSTTFTFSQFTPLDDVFVYWQTELGVPLLIDWPALATVELGPRSTIACAIGDRPWSEALERVLEPLGLGWRTTPGGAVEITTAEKVQTELVLDVYRLRRDLEVEARALVTQLRQVAEKHGGGGVVAYDPVGHVVLSLEPASVQRLFLAQLKARLRSDDR